MKSLQDRKKPRRNEFLEKASQYVVDIDINTIREVPLGKGSTMTLFEAIMCQKDAINFGAFDVFAKDMKVCVLGLKSDIGRMDFKCLERLTVEDADFAFSFHSVQLDDTYLRIVLKDSFEDVRKRNDAQKKQEMDAYDVHIEEA